MFLTTDAMSANSRDVVRTFTALSYTASLPQSATSGSGSGRCGADGATRQCSHNTGCEITTTQLFLTLHANLSSKGQNWGNEFKMSCRAHSSEAAFRDWRTLMFTTIKDVNRGKQLHFGTCKQLDDSSMCRHGRISGGHIECCTSCKGRERNQHAINPTRGEDGVSHQRWQQIEQRHLVKEAVLQWELLVNFLLQQDSVTPIDTWDVMMNANFNH